MLHPHLLHDHHRLRSHRNPISTNVCPIQRLRRRLPTARRFRISRPHSFNFKNITIRARPGLASPDTTGCGQADRDFGPGRTPPSAHIKVTFRWRREKNVPKFRDACRPMCTVGGVFGGRSFPSYGPHAHVWRRLHTFTHDNPPGMRVNVSVCVCRYAHWFYFDYMRGIWMGVCG